METIPIVQLFLALAILIIAAEFFGTLARVLGQPRVFGALMAGVIIGPNVLDFMQLPMFAELGVEEHHFLEHSIEILAELGVMFLMFNVGLDVHLRELLSVGRAAVFGGTAGAVVPTVFAVAVVLAYNYTTEVALFAGVALAATSVSISAQTLLELGLLRSKEGNTVLAAAIVDDVLAILLLSFVTATVGTSVAHGADSSLVLIAAKMFGYVSIAMIIGWYALPKIVAWLGRNEHTTQLVAPVAVVFALLFAWSAEEFGGVAAITGAFIAGAGLSRAPGDIKRTITTNVSSITYAFLAPIFFVSIGLKIDLANFPMEAVVFTSVLLLLGVATKVIGCGFGAKLAGNLTNVEALRVGVCMVSRGEVGLIIMNEGIRRGVFADAGYVDASLLVVVLLTTVFTPPLVRWSFQLKDGKQERTAPGESSQAQTSEAKVP